MNNDYSMNFNKKSLELHKKHKGKIEIKVKVPLQSRDDLSIAYTPGVAAVVKTIKKNKKQSWRLTNRANSIAIVTDGSAVLGLGKVGAEAAMPIMESKSAIFKEFANIDAYPLCINTYQTDEIVKFCKYIEPSFAGINLEDISSPRCFEIVERLEKELSIPVFHDDQDGTAIVTLAALINACRVTGRVIKELRVVINGAGAAGIAIARLLITQGVKNIILLDSKGIIYSGRRNLNIYKKAIAQKINREKLKGKLDKALVGADVFIGVSTGNLINQAMVKSMNKQPIIFAMSNPIPEIMPNNALKARAVIVGTGRSDFPNQINNALVFPGIFRGLLNGHINKITTRMKVAVALAIAYSIKPKKDRILPLIFDKRVVKVVSQAVVNSK